MTVVSRAFRLLALTLLLPASGFGSPLTIHVTGTLSPSSAAISKLRLLYFFTGPGANPEINFIVAGSAELVLGDCAVQDAPCAVSGAIQLENGVPETTIISKYTILGFYGGGPNPETDFQTNQQGQLEVVQNPRVLVLTDPTFEGGVSSFQNLYSYDENQAATYIYEEGTPSFGADFLYASLPVDLYQFPILNFDAPTAQVRIWDYSNGTPNGTGSFQFTTQSDVPEPSSVLLMSGGLGLLALRTYRRRRLSSCSV